MRIFDLGKGYQIVAEWKKTRNGFKHEATLLKDGQEVDKAKVNYLNRTWESYEYQTVLQKLIKNTSALSEQEKKAFMDWSRKDHTDWSQFRMTAGIAKLGEILAPKDKKSKIDWKARMLKAGLNIELPDDWDELSDDEKERRLDKVIELAQNAGRPNPFKSKKGQFAFMMTPLVTKGKGWWGEKARHRQARYKGMR